MNPNFITAGGSSAVVTCVIFYAMQALVATQSGPTRYPGKLPELVFLPEPQPEEHIIVDRPFMERPQFPEIPKTPRPQPSGENNGTIGISHSGPTPPGPTPHIFHNPNQDGPLVNVIRVQPNYPMRAMQQGLEGYVIVQFDVATSGHTINVFAYQSSHTLFENAAIEAAGRLRYKASIIDGVAVASKGMRYRFVFSMQE
jgi:protein TonB